MISKQLLKGLLLALVLISMISLVQNATETLMSCIIKGKTYDNNGGCTTPTADTGCPVSDTALWKYASGTTNCVPLHINACRMFGLKYDGTSTPKACLYFTTASDKCPLDSSSLWLAVDADGGTNNYCTPKTDLACKAFGLVYNTTSSLCNAPSGQSSCPSSVASLWLHASSGCTVVGALDVACQALGLKISATTNTECDIPINTDCAFSQANAWTFDTTVKICKPLVEIACRALGLVFTAANAPCVAVTSQSNCPEGADYWTITSGRCVAQNSAACQMIGLTYLSSDTKYSACKFSTACPLTSAKMFELSNSGVCTPLQDYACYGIGLKYDATNKKCIKTTSNTECQISPLWKYDTTDKRCLTSLKEACYHFGLNYDNSINQCKSFSSGDCTGLLSSVYFSFSTDTEQCLPLAQEGCLNKAMLYTAGKPCQATYSDSQCQLLHPSLVLYITPNSASTMPTAFGCTIKSPDTSTEGYKYCLTKGLRYSVANSVCQVDGTSPTTTYPSTLYQFNSTTQLVYPLDNVADGCLQYTLAYAGNGQFCAIATQANCVSSGLYWYTSYDPKDLSQNSCKGASTSGCKIPSKSSECPTTSYYDTTGALALTSYKCILKTTCGKNYFTNNGYCYSSCPSLVGLVTPLAGESSVACVSCATGCTGCANSTAAGISDCSGCSSGYFYNSTAKTCTSCSAMPNCISCGSSTSCASCQLGFIKIAGTGTTPKDSCLSCTDFKPNCGTCSIDSTSGKVNQCLTCQESTIYSVNDTTLIDKCVCKLFKSVYDLRTKINDATTPYIKTLSTYALLNYFYFEVNCQILEVAPTGCDILIDSPNDLIIFKKVLDQFTIILSQQTSTLASAGFSSTNLAQLLLNFVNTPLTKALDKEGLQKTLAIVNNINFTGTSDAITSIINVLLTKITPAATSYTDYDTDLSTTFSTLNRLLLNNPAAINLAKDAISYDAYVFSQIKPIGVQVGLTIDIGTNGTIFDGKVTDFTQAKVVIGRTILKYVTKVSSTNQTMKSSQINYQFAQAIAKIDATNATSWSYAKIDDIAIPAKSCAKFSFQLATAYTLTDTKKVIYVAQWDDTKKIWDVNAVTTTSTANPYTGCVPKTLAQPLIVMEASKKGSFSNILAIGFGLIASLFFLF